MTDAVEEYVYRHPIARLYYGEWRFCGCGNPEELMELVRDALAAIEARSKAWRADTEAGGWALLSSDPEFYDRIADDIIKPVFGDDRRTDLMWYWLDSVGLTEHGGGIGGSWLTEKGEAVLAMLRDETLMADWDGDEESGFSAEMVRVTRSPSLTEMLPPDAGN